MGKLQDFAVHLNGGPIAGAGADGTINQQDNKIIKGVLAVYGEIEDKGEGEQTSIAMAINGNARAISQAFINSMGEDKSKGTNLQILMGQVVADQLMMALLKPDTKADLQHFTSTIIEHVTLSIPSLMQNGASAGAIKELISCLVNLSGSDLEKRREQAELVDVVLSAGNLMSEIMNDIHEEEGEENE